MFTDRLLDGFYKDIRSDSYKDPNQIEMEFLWPHRGVQLELDLDKPEPKYTYSPTNFEWGSVVPSNTTWGTTAINSPSFEINITDSVGNLKIGGMSVGLKKSPKWYQRILYKLLGFKWNGK